MKKLLLTILSATFFSGSIYAQQGLTLYHMNRVLQSQWINPATELEYSTHIGGLIIPVFGQLPPPFYMNYANNSFYYNHLIHMGSGDKAGNLVINTSKFMNSLQSTTHLRFENQIELLSLGIKSGNLTVTFSISERLRYGVSLPYDFFEFAVNGNRPYMLENKAHDFSSFDMNFTHYREFAFGFSNKINDRLNIGARAKVLYGQANVSTEIETLSLYTDPETYHMTLTTDLIIRNSLPVYFDYQTYEDSIVFDINQNSVDNLSPEKYFANTKNIGFAFDLGFSYELNRKMQIFASATDIGVITWNTHPQNFVSKGSFLFRGIQINILDEDFEPGEDLLDTIINQFQFELQENSYVTWLPSSVYAGGLYKFHDKLHLGILGRAEFYRGNILPSVTLSANSNLTKWFSAHLSYSYANNYFGNVGLGITTRLGFVNWYIVTDNFMGMIFPQKSKNFNIRFGCNLVFGRPKKSIASYR